MRKELWRGGKELQEGQANNPNHGRTDTLEGTCDRHDSVIGCFHKEDLSS